MKTIKIMFTRGDRATQPGGLILRYNEAREEYVTHCFNRVPHTREPTEYYWGHYFHGEDAEARALADYDERYLRHQRDEISEGELIAKGDAYLQPMLED